MGQDGTHLRRLHSHHVGQTQTRRTGPVAAYSRQRLHLQGHYAGQYCVFDELYVDSAGPGAPCPECGRPTETVREENYFFKLSAFQDKLLDLYEGSRISSAPNHVAMK